jgi:hypothetical protein
MRASESTSGSRARGHASTRTLWLALALSTSACSLDSLAALQRGADGGGADGGGADGGRADSEGADADAPQDPRPESRDAGQAHDAASAFDSAVGDSDASASDASASDASGSDTRLDAGAPMTAWCPDTSPRPLCDDFESGSLSTDGRGDWSWFEVLGTPPGSGTLSNPSGLPGGRGFRAAVGPTSKEQGATLAKQLPPNVASLRVAFDMTGSISVGSPIQGSGLVIAKLEQQVADEYPGVSLEAVPTGMLLHVENVIGGTTIVASDQLGAYPRSGITRVQLDVTFGAQGSVRLSYDGVLQLEKTNIQVGSAAAEDTVLLLGLYTESAPASFVLYDNVSLSFQ